VTPNEPRAHHYVPQFYLRSFAVDAEKKKVTTVSKNGDHAIWAQRSISTLGYENDLYVHIRQGVPFSVERAIAEGIETPISRSDTWSKITSGRADELDRSDKPILYALIRHLNTRTPHFLETTLELARLAASSQNEISFTEEERDFYAQLNRRPENARLMFNAMASTLSWTSENYQGCGLSVYRSPIPICSSSVPVVSLSIPPHPALRLATPDAVPFQMVLPLSPTVFATLVLADFDDAFTNSEVSAEVALGLRRHVVGHFAHFPHVRHLITGRDGLEQDMTWAPYEIIEDDGRRLKFRRRA
jgi:hypothetical protein